LETPKSGHGRSVQISESLAKRLVFHETMKREEKERFGWSEIPRWLFVTIAGTPVDPANVRRSMQRILKEARLPLHFTPHCLRHTYASILLAEGTPAPFVQEQLGHASIELTVSTYGRWLKKKPLGHWIGST
jgi:integrase